jgi:hypothetical protein
VIVILSIVSAITVKFLVDSMRIYKMTVNQKTLLDEAKLALERMCRDIRDARSITGSTATSITFTRTNATAPAPNGDGIGESITFRLNPTDTTILEKVKNSPNGPTNAMANNVNTFAVTQGADNEITLVLTLRMTGSEGENVTLQTRVYPKNLAKGTTYKNFYQNWMEVIQ